MNNHNTIFSPILLVLGWLALSPVTQAKQPSEDRGNGNSAAEDVQALSLSTTGSNNTAHGWFSLFSNTSGSSNTANGFQALYSNTTGVQNIANGALAPFQQHRRQLKHGPMAFKRSLTTPLVQPTQQTVFLRSLVTRKAVLTPPSVTLRSLTTPPAA